MASTMATQHSEGYLMGSRPSHGVTQTGRTGRMNGAVVSDEQLDSLLHDDWQKDDYKSLSRRVVEGFLSTVSSRDFSFVGKKNKEIRNFNIVWSLVFMYT